MFLVDPEDEYLLRLYTWYELVDGNTSYVYANAHKPDGSPTTVKLHRLIMGLGKGDEHILVDHINGNGLDNRRINLRRVTRSQNAANSHRPRGKSQYKGVYWHSGPGGRTPRWRAMIRMDGRRISLGYFDSEEEAARAYDAKAKEVHGDFALLNFP